MRKLMLYYSEKKETVYKFNFVLSSKVIDTYILCPVILPLETYSIRYLHIYIYIRRRAGTKMYIAALSIVVKSSGKLNFHQ